MCMDFTSFRRQNHDSLVRVGNLGRQEEACVVLLVEVDSIFLFALFVILDLLDNSAGIHVERVPELHWDVGLDE